jgi:hypothetical protein
MNSENISHVGEHWKGQRLFFILLTVISLFQILVRLSCDRTIIAVSIRFSSDECTP